MSKFSTSASVLALATIFALGEGTGGSPAYAADLGKGGLKDTFEADAPRSSSWTGPWGAIIGGYNILTQTYNGEPEGFSLEGGFVQGEIGYDYQVSGRIVLGAFGCASYSGIQGLAEGYCIQGRGGILVTPDSLLFATAGWRWQGFDGEGTTVYANGPVAGLGLESRLSKNIAVKLSYEHQWITEFNGETVPSEIDFGDNRVMAGVVFRY